MFKDVLQEIRDETSKLKRKTFNFFIANKLNNNAETYNKKVNNFYNKILSYNSLTLKELNTLSKSVSKYVK